MTENLFLLITKDLIFYGYVIIIFSIYGFQSSISQTAYELRKTKDYWIFCLVTLSYATLGFIIYPSLVTGLMSVGLYFAAAAPWFRDNSTQTITHYFGANLAMAGSFYLLFWEFNLPTLAYSMAITLLLLEYIPGFVHGLKVQNKTTWIEIIIYTFTAAGYYLKF